MNQTKIFLDKLPVETSHIFVGGSTGTYEETKNVVESLKRNTNFPVFLFPGSYHQITEKADALLFLSFISGNNPEYLIGQQVKSIEKLKNSSLEILSTGYILIDGGTKSAVARVSGTKPISQKNIEQIVTLALAGQFSGKKLIYLEAGSDARFPVSNTIISAVKIPVIVGGGIKTLEKLQQVYHAGADMVVMGTVFES